jgi:hypothetical protein
MRWESGKIYWYFVKYQNGIGIVKTKSLRNSNDLFAGLKIEKILTPETYLGNKHRIYEGAEISANELQGVGGGGPDKYFFAPHKLFDQIFS